MIKLDTTDSHTVMRLEHGKVNALDVELLTQLADIVDELEGQPYGPVILTGSGSSFSAGVDLWRVLEGGDDYVDTFLPALNRALSSLFSMSRPVVAAVNGHAIAGGCVLVCACDYRIMADGSGVMGVPELRVGVPFPPLALEVLHYAVGGDRMHELVFLGNTYGAHVARELGLIDEICSADELMQRAAQVADSLAAIPQASFRITKKQLHQPTLNRVDLLRELTDDEVHKAWSDPSIHEAIRDYMERTVKKPGR